MTLFFISLILTAITGFFVTAVFEQKNFVKIFIYMCLVMFGITVLNVELLSLISKISTVGILVLNTLFAGIAGYVWAKNGRPWFNIRCKRFFKRLYYSVMSDKYLLVLGISFLIMCGVSLFLISVVPIVNPDAEAYHAVRSLFWIGNGNLNHFPIADTRALIMPINSEILYLWMLIFLKKQLWLGIFSFVGFLLSVTSIYGILTKIRISERAKLWTIFIFSSFPSVIVQLSGTETDIIVAGLVCASIYLYLNSFTSDKKQSELYFSALAFALAIGTKTPALMLAFPVGLWMLWIGYKYLKRDFYKPFVKFIGFGLVNFIIFASYNYILNFIDYGNPFGAKYFVAIHQNLFGIKGAIAGFVKHIFLFFDFTGFKWNEIFGPHLISLKNGILDVLNLSYVPDGINSGETTNMNRTLLEPVMGMGILGFLVYLPCWLYSMIRPVFSKKVVDKLICSFGLILLGAICVMSYKITFMQFNIRFLTSFCVVAAPILVYSYARKNNPMKFLVTGFALFGFLFVSTHLWARPFTRIYSYLRQGVSIQKIRRLEQCSGLPKKFENPMVIRNQICKTESQIQKYGKTKRFLYFPNTSERLFVIQALKLDGYNIDYATLEKADEIDFDKYDVIVTRSNEQFIENKQNSPTDFKDIEGVECNYESAPASTMLPNNEDILFIKYCKADEQFFKTKGFELKHVFPHTKYEKFEFDYMFYEKKLP